ncbi:MAG: InlB B-repeat-containing protein, partial [Clostridia bacterium]|nr:InlB B-repeat-containing protein [Clostridia bacterium]
WKKFAGLVVFDDAIKAGAGTKDPQPVTKILLEASVLANAGTTNIYYDDIAFIPSYKATYMMNDGTDEEFASEYFLFPDNDVTKAVVTEYTIKTDLAPARTDYVLTGWSTDKDATEPDADGVVSLANEDVVLYAVWEKDTSIRKTVKPGLNMVGGQDSPWTSEEADGMSDISSFFTTDGGTLSVKENPKKDDVNSSDYVVNLAITSTTQKYPKVKFDLPKALESSRPIHISTKYYKEYIPADGEALIDTEYILWVMQDPGGNVAWSPANNKADGTWKSISAIKDFNNSTSTIYFQTKHHAGNAGTVNYVFDDISFIPEYQITYMMNDGSDDVVYTDFALYEDDDITKPMLTKYTVDETVEPKTRYKYTFLGWSTDKNATSADAAVTEVALDNEDIVLYAIWEEDTTLPDEVTLKWDFETEDTRTWYLNNGGYTTKYENGMYIVDTTGRINTSHIKHPNFTGEEDLILSTAALRYLVFNVRSLDTVNYIKVYFTTSKSTGYSEDKTVNIPIDASSSV